MIRTEQQIDRLAATDQTKFKSEFRLQRPVVLIDGLRNWPDTLFGWKRLADLFGAEPVLTYRLPPETPALRMSAIKSNFYFWTDEEGDRNHLRKWTFGEFLAALKKGEAHYCMANQSKNTKLRNLLSAEVGNFDCHPVAGGKPEPTRCEFFGSENTGPGLHHDGAVESFLCQLIGAKRVNVFSPADIPYLYPGASWLAPTGHFSAVADSFNTDAGVFPLFKLATLNSCELHPGDVLYLPPHWYHDPCPQGPGAMMTIRNTPPAETWGTEEERDKLANAVSVLYQCLREFSPTARATYSALLSNDLLSGLYSRVRKRNAHED